MFRRNWGAFLIAGTFSLCFAASARCQSSAAGPPPGAGPPLNKSPNIDDRSRQVSESELRNAGIDPVTAEEKEKRLQRAIANMKEDFARIQVLRNDIARDLAARKPVDYKLVAEQTAEINKRSNRLNLYLRAHRPADEKEAKSADLPADEMIDSLVTLCKLIDSFTENPVLKDLEVVDLKDVVKRREERARADRDLLTMIKLSAKLQKESKNLAR